YSPDVSRCGARAQINARPSVIAQEALRSLSMRLRLLRERRFIAVTVCTCLLIAGRSFRKARTLCLGRTACQTEIYPSYAYVTPAKAGVQCLSLLALERRWAPAFAGATSRQLVLHCLCVEQPFHFIHDRVHAFDHGLVPRRRCEVDASGV